MPTAAFSRSSLRPLLATTIPVFALLALVYLVSQSGFTTIDRLMLDPAAALGESVSLGVISYLGVLAWAVAAAICLFAGFVLYGSSTDTDRIRFLVCAGALTGVLCVDDWLLIHERIGPNHLGVPEKVVFGSYAAGAAALFARFRATVLQTELLLLASAAGAFATSIVLDLSDDALRPLIGGDMQVLAEDGAKLLGIALWVVYLIRTSASSLGNAIRSPAA